MVGEVSISDVFGRGVSVEDMSGQGIVRRGCFCSCKSPSGMCLVGELSVKEVSVG